MATHDLTLNLIKESIAPQVITVRQGDSAEVLNVSLYDGDKEADLTGCEVHLLVAKPDHTYVEQRFTGINGNVATITVNPAAFGVVGLLKVCYVRVRNAAGLDSTTENILVNVLTSASAEGTVSGPYIDAVEEIIADLRSQLKDVTELNTQMQEAEAERKTAESERVKAEDGRVEAENERVTAENGRKQAEAERVNEWAEIKADVGDAIVRADDASSRAVQAANSASAAGDSANAAAAKAEAAVSTAEAANTAATQAVSDARDAIAEVKATEAKLYPAAENILVGSETGLVAHVDDAFEGASLRKITVEGACKQDGIPSLDAPKPIAVIENPTVKIVGRNLVDVPSMTVAANQLTSNKIDCGLIPQGENAYLSFVSSAESVSVNRTAAAWGLFDKDDNPRWSLVPTDFAKGINRSKLKSPFDAIKHRIIPCYRKPATAFEMSNYQLELGGYHDYRPHTKQSIAFTLPAEHPYLAKLPDGTADEIVVDEEGNVELVARISKVIPKDADTLNFGAGTDTDAPYVSFRISGLASRTGILCNSYQTSGLTNKSGYIYCPNGLDVEIRDDRFESKEKAIELLNGVVVYVAVEPTRYPLGKIEMPKTQDSIINAWTEAEVTPNTGIGYVRDVNIVVGNLEESIASIS